MATKRIPYGHQSVDEADIAAVVEVLRSDWLTQGPMVQRFEDAVAGYCGAPYATAVCNATAGLHLAYRALELGPGDVLWTSPNTFVATTNAALLCGAEVDFVDIDPATYNLSIQALEVKLDRAAETGKLPKIVVPVHFAGQPCDMRALRNLAQRYGFRVVEDASHAIGASFEGSALGNAAFSDMVVFSFHPVKLITTGEGGMVLTRSSELHKRAQLLRSHGITREPALMQAPTHEPWYYEQLDLGYNYRMTDIQAALGYSQLQRLDSFVERRHYLAARYDTAFRDLPLQCPARLTDSRSAFHIYVINCLSGTQCRNRLANVLIANGIGVNLHYIPVYRQPYYKRMGFHASDFPQAEKYYERAITLPLFPGLSDGEQDRVITQIRELFERPRAPS